MPESDVQELQEDLKSSELWEKNLAIQPKCHALKVTKATKHKITTSYCLHGTQLENLGVIIQSDLKWSKKRPHYYNQS